MIPTPRARHPALAAGLSFVFPGLGQAYAGRVRPAVLLAAPVLALVAVVSAFLALRGPQLRNDVLSSSFLWTVIAVNAAVLVWRVVAIGHAWLSTDADGRTDPSESTEPRPVDGRRLSRARMRARLIGSRAGSRVRRQPWTVAAVAAMLAATVAMHAYIAVLAATLNATLEDVFVQTAAAEPEPGVEQVPGRPLNLPEYRWDGTERINFLLLGVDAGGDRPHALDDTILVASVDPVARSAVLVSVPRDTAFVPLPDARLYADRIYPHRINQLSSDARLAPEEWCPDLAPTSADECGIRTLQRTVSLYLGIPIHYYARVDLEGFAELIDALGGVEICLRGRLVDPEYSGPTWYSRPVGITLEPGCRRLPGPEALAYARIRKGWLELPGGQIDYQNDFKRAARQQELLLALRRELQNVNPLELPAVLGAVATTASTDFPRAKAGDLASLVPLITRSDVERVVLGYPEYVDPPINEAEYYILFPKRDAIREKMVELFGDNLEGWYVGTDEAAPASPEPAAVSGAGVARLIARSSR